MRPQRQASAPTSVQEPRALLGVDHRTEREVFRTVGYRSTTESDRCCGFKRDLENGRELARRTGVRRPERVRRCRGTFRRSPGPWEVSAAQTRNTAYRVWRMISRPYRLRG